MRQYLLTCESIDDERDVRQITERVQRLPHRVILRIPIQWNGHKMDDPQAYEKTFQMLSEHADLMIEFVDSDAARHLTETQYEAHVQACLEVLGQYCKIGEAGNEINGGNWNDEEGEHPHPPEEVVQMVRGAVVACGNAGLTAAITYYLSTDEQPPMLEWMDRYATDLRADYALISHYPNSARVAFTTDQMFEIFRKFSGIAHATIIGWGEYGTEGKFKNIPKDGKDIVRTVEQEYWQRFAQIPKYAGLGGYWDWKTETYIDEILQQAWQ
jgi:hypothetical protein